MVETPDFLKDAVSRRAFLARMTAAGLGTAAAALLAGCGGGGGNNGNGSTTGTGSTGTTTFADQANFPGIAGQNENVVVLNFALTLEHLEADLYRQLANIATGQNLPFGGKNVYSSPTLAISNGGLDSNQTAAGLAFLTQYAAAEAAHRDFLVAAIPAVAGGTAVPPNPKGYTTAGLVPTSPTLKDILTFLQQVEEEGVRAYSGAAGFISNTMLTQAAATIFTTEARHSAGLNYALGRDAGPSQGSSAPTSPDTQIVQVDGTKVSNNTLEYVKKPTQVLNDVRPFFVQ